MAIGCGDGFHPAPSTPGTPRPETLAARRKTLATVLAGVVAGSALCDVAAARPVPGRAILEFVAREPTPLTVGFDPGVQTFTFGPLDTDELLDLIAIDQQNGGVVLLSNLGEGQFASPRRFPIGALPTAVSAGRLDGDQLVDVVVVDDEGTATTFRGDPDSGLEFREELDVGFELNGVVVAPLDQDAAADLALLDSCNEVLLQQNAGDGAFQCFPDDLLETGGDEPIAIEGGDFNGDGHVDLVVLNRVSVDVSLLLGNGDGTFAPAAAFPLSGDPRDLAVGRIDGDAVDDVVVIESGLFSDDNVSVLLGTNDAGLRAGPKSRTPVAATSIALGDFDVDGCADVVAAVDSSGPVTARGDCSGAFATATEVASLGPGRIVEVSDLDGDQIDDFVVLDASGEVLSPALNRTLAPSCRGDCDRNGTVNLTELVRGLMITLEDVHLERCPALDRNRDHHSTIDELLGAIDAALVGCNEK